MPLFQNYKLIRNKISTFFINKHLGKINKMVNYDTIDDQQQHRYHSITSNSSSSGPSTFERTNAMPSDEKEILLAFEEVLKSMDLPPDKMRTLRNCDLKKKWDLVCDQRQFSMDHVVTDPSVYLDKLKIYMDKKALKKNKKYLAGESSTSLLKHIEISLRTNTIEWVRQFLSPKTDGLRILVDYISFLQDSFFNILANADHHDKEPSSSASFAPISSQFASSDQKSSKGSQQGIQQQNPFNASYSSVSSLQALNQMNVSTHSSATNREENTKMSTFRMPYSTKHSTKTGGKNAPNLDAMDDDIHVGISCLRALLNNKFGITAVFGNTQAIYCIVRAILHPSLRTKALALDLLSGIVSLADGHELVLNAFDKFRIQYGELFRFQSLVHCFKSSTNVNVDFLTSCIKFINVLVHSTADMNQRVALQHEFACLNLESHLENLSVEFPESDFLLTHINLYDENCIDVELLHEKSIKCDELEQEMNSLQSECSRQKEEFQVLQADCYVQIAQLNAQLKKLSEEKTDLERQKAHRDAKITTLTKDWKEREAKFESERGELEQRISLLEQAKKEIQQSLKIAQHAPPPPTPPQITTPKPSIQRPVQAKTISTENEVPDKQIQQKVKSTAPPPPPLNGLGKNDAIAKQMTVPAPPPPPPPPPAISLNSRPKSTMAPGAPPPPPPPLGGLLAPKTQQQIELPKKRILATKSKLPILNWTTLNPNQVKGTIFNELDDEKLVDVLDLTKLESLFGGGTTADERTSKQLEEGGGNTEETEKPPQPSPIGGGNGKTSLLGTKRLQNIAIIRRKLGKSHMEIMSAVHRFDLSVLGPDQVDILLPIVPTQEEMTKLREYSAQHSNSFEALTNEDQFLAELMGIERITQKLLLMKFMGDFEDSIKLLIPQLQKVTAAAKSIHKAKKFPKVIEIILAVGNAMNGARRAPVYGFRIGSLDSLSILKSPKDRTVTLLHCIVELIGEKFPNLLDFGTELKLAESAATVNMESISADVRDIETKFGQAMAEQNRKGKEESPALLNAFIESAAEKIASLQEHFKLAQESYGECAEYFGEVPAKMQPDVFFTRIVSFCKHFDAARAENEAKRQAEMRHLQEEEQQKRRSAQIQHRRSAAKGGGANINGAGGNGTDLLLDELNAKFMQSMNGSGQQGGGNSRLKSSNKLGDGDFERIMVELKDGFVASNSMMAAPIAAKRRGGKSPSPNREREKLNSSREQERSS